MQVMGGKIFCRETISLKTSWNLFSSSPSGSLLSTKRLKLVGLTPTLKPPIKIKNKSGPPFSSKASFLRAQTFLFNRRGINLQPRRSSYDIDNPDIRWCLKGWNLEGFKRYIRSLIDGMKNKILKKQQATYEILPGFLSIGQVGVVAQESSNKHK